MTLRTAVALVGLLATAGCGAEEFTACPADAVVLSPNVMVQLAGDWPEGDAATVVLRCTPACVVDMKGDPTSDTLSSPVDGGVAGFDVLADPDTVVVTVLDLDGGELAEMETGLEFERVGGSEECGGPMRATVTIPAP